MKTLLLCSDLDRTLIPNGIQPESPEARRLLRHLAKHPELKLAYVSGRNDLLVKDAIETYELPEPDFVIGDVGTTLYRLVKGSWQLDRGWHEEIGKDWKDSNRDDVVELLAERDNLDLELQEDAKQNSYKISYYTAVDIKPERLKKLISDSLEECRMFSTVIWSIDEEKDCGLLDILPRRANKLQAIRYLIRDENIADENMVFAGDSGNDLEPLTSGFRAILVKNSSTDVREQAREGLSKQGFSSDSLYIARGGLYGMNGNYAAGVLEGLVHFFPHTAEWFLPHGDDKPA